MRNTKRSMTILWLVVAVLAIARLANTLLSNSISIPVLVLAVAFALMHGSVRYRWSGMVTFLVICVLVSNLLENSSILTGFPFGHYYYTAPASAKLFLVPLMVGPLYFSTGYLAWMLSIVLVGDVDRNARWSTTLAVPFIASFFMVMWDLSFDPSLSTIQHLWIWEQGGGYFGVPLTNYLGWFFTVFVFFQLFALFLRFRDSADDEIRRLPRLYYAQPIILYAVLGVTFVLPYIMNTENAAITDAAGVVWQTRSIAEAEATISIFTMIFVAALSAVKLFQSTAESPVRRLPMVDAPSGSFATPAQSALAGVDM